MSFKPYQPVEFRAERPKDTDDPTLAGIYDKQFAIDKKLEWLHGERDALSLEINDLNLKWHKLNDAAKVLEENEDG
jgi:hypothetical protein